MPKFSVTTIHEVDLGLTSHIAEVFAEWLEAQGFVIERHKMDPLDERSYQELASDFAKELDEKAWSPPALFRAGPSA